MKLGGLIHWLNTGNDRRRYFFLGGRLSRNCNELQWDAVDRPVDDGKDSSIKVSIEIVKLQI